MFEARFVWVADRGDTRKNDLVTPTTTTTTEDKVQSRKGDGCCSCSPSLVDSRTMIVAVHIDQIVAAAVVVVLGCGNKRWGPPHCDHGILALLTTFHFVSPTRCVRLDCWLQIAMNEHHCLEYLLKHIYLRHCRRLPHIQHPNENVPCLGLEFMQHRQQM